jgi:hypothetical protein
MQCSADSVVSHRFLVAYPRGAMRSVVDRNGLWPVAILESLALVADDLEKVQKCTRT